MLALLCAALLLAPAANELPPAAAFWGALCTAVFIYLLAVRAGLSRTMRPEDRQAVQNAMADTGVAAWAGRDLRELSGGERQRVYIAMALAQDTDVILLDEPTTYLDINHQFELLELIRRLNERGKTVVMVLLHELAHTLRYSHQIVVLRGGGMPQCGTPAQIFESGIIETAFGVQAHRTQDGYYFTPLR